MAPARRAKELGAARLRGALPALALACAGWALATVAAPAQTVRVENVAALEFTHFQGVDDRAASNIDAFEVITDFEPGQMSILRPSASGGERFTVGVTRYSPTGELSGAFTQAPAPMEYGRPITMPVALEPAPALSNTGALFVKIIDQRMNRAAAAVERLTLTVSVPETADAEMLQLEETGPDTGVFVGGFSTAPAVQHRRDGRLPIQRGHGLVVTRADMGARNELARIKGQSKSFGVVVSSATGQPLNGVRLTLVHADSGLPAEVFSDDGVTVYPSTVRSGMAVVDGAGRRHEAEPGSYRFPSVAAGTYRLAFEPPLGFKGPTSAPLPVLLSLREGWLIFDEAASWGAAFVHPGGQLASFDLPLDPDGELKVTKTTNRTVASLGDVVYYGVDLVADGSGAAGVEVIDDPPEGFHYRARSARVDGEPIAEPTVGADGRLRFVMGNFQPSQARRLSYALQIGGRTRLGQAVNRAYAVDAPGRVSNTSVAALRVRDDFLGRTASIVGRVTAGACGIEGEGVEGVRVYLEDGAVAVTDRRGRYHFEDMRPGAHVVKLDRASLPQGAAPIACGRRNRGLATRFVDLQGGSVWRADFHLTVPEAAAPPATPPEAEAPEGAVAVAAATTDLPADAALVAREGLQRLAFVTPEAGHQPRIRSVHVTLRHDRSLKVTLSQGGRPAPAENYEGSEDQADGTTFSEWRGLDLVDGANRFVAVATDAEGREVARVERVVSFGGQATVARLDRARSQLDTGDATVIAVAVTDAEGRPARPGTFVEASVEPPHALHGSTPAAPLHKGTLEVAEDGVLLVRLAPVDQAGRVLLTVGLPSGDETFEVELREAARDWLLVGLAAGGAGQASDDEFLNTSLFDSRVAFFAKGRLHDDWSLKVGYDSERGVSEERLFAEPEARSVYPLFGDQSRLGHEAASSGSLYARIENDRTVAEYGDFEAGFFGTELTAYRRRMHGIQASWTGERTTVQSFVSDTRSQFARDEIPVDGTSGVFRLRRAPAIVNSELVTLEIRDRFRAGEVRSRRALARHVDYEIDYGSGEIFLTDPVLDIDSGFEAVVLTVEYETLSVEGLDPSLGLRADRQLFAGHVGATYVREPSGGVTGQLFGVHAEAPLSEHTRVRAEAAMSDGEAGEGSAFDAEVLHEKEHLSGRLYLTQQDGAFGLGRRRASLSGVTEAGAEGRLELPSLGDAVLRGQAYRRDSAMVGGARTLAEVGLARDVAGGRVDVGLRHVEDVADADGSSAASDQLLVGGSRDFLDDRLTLRLAREQSLSGRDEVLEFPTRTLVRADWRLNPVSSVYVTHEWLESGERRGQLNRFGVRGAPWEGAQVNASADQFASSAGERLGVSYGASQSLQIDARWMVSAGVQRRQGLKGDVSAPAVTSLRFGEGAAVGEDFTAAHLAVAAQLNAAVFSARLEGRRALSGDKVNLLAYYTQTREEGLVYGGRLRLTRDEGTAAETGLEGEVRLGLAYRTEDGPVLLSRLDLERDLFSGATRLPETQTATKLVSNSVLNMPLGEADELSIFLAAKVAFDQFEGEDELTVSNLFALEYRRAVGSRFDVGLRGSALRIGSDPVAFSLAPSVGVSLGEAVWVSVGYNIGRVQEDDFGASATGHDGAFVRFRFKFDEVSVRQLVDRF